MSQIELRAPAPVCNPLEAPLPPLQEPLAYGVGLTVGWLAVVYALSGAFFSQTTALSLLFTNTVLAVAVSGLTHGLFRLARPHVTAASALGLALGACAFVVAATSGALAGVYWRQVMLPLLPATVGAVAVLVLAVVLRSRGRGAVAESFALGGLVSAGVVAWLTL